MLPSGCSHREIQNAALTGVEVERLTKGGGPLDPLTSDRSVTSIFRLVNTICQGCELPHHESSPNGFVASFKNLVETVRKEALEKGAKDEVDDGREASVGTRGIGQVSAQ
jgi:hypothetical protein